MAGKFLDAHAPSSLLQIEEIHDQPALKAFHRKRSEWFSSYDVAPDEPNSIQLQIIEMIVSEMRVRILWKEIAQQQKGTGLAIPIIADVLNRSYLDTQVLATRKLLDLDERSLSLARLLIDLEENQHLFTRELYVSFDGTPYISPSDSSPMVSPAQIRSHHRHNRFDKLSRISPINRSRFDRLSPDVFKVLRSWIDVTDAHRLIALGNKYIAHAANSRSRGQINFKGLTFTHIEKIQRALIRVERGIFDIILNSGVVRDVVPMMSLDYFGTVCEGDKFVPPTSRMQNQWDELKKNRDGWTAGIENTLVYDLNKRPS
jgi:hypothetical protein